MTKPAEYTFGDRDYLKFMPVQQTDQFKHRLHECPICGRKLWSVWGHASKHWQKHAPEEERCPNDRQPE